MTGRVLVSDRDRRISSTSSPPIPGIRRANKTRSKVPWATNSRALAPLPVSPTPYPAADPANPAREVGRRVVASLRRSAAERLAQAWRSDPDRLAAAVDLGIVNKDWVDAPSEHAFTAAAPMEVVERFLERTAAERPSMLA